MPEGDSVFRLAARLRGTVAGREIVAGELRSGKAAGTSLAGWRIAGFETHGKHLITWLDPDFALHTHLLMQGSWTVTGPRRALPPGPRSLARVRAELEDGSTLWGIDMPVVDLVRASEIDGVLAHLGPDPLRADWDADEAVRRLRTQPDRPFAAALLDQRNIAGLGNLWANELAFLSGIHPFDPIGRCDVAAVVSRAARALRVSATVPSMYQVTTGNTRRGSSHWVAGRAGRPCLRCGTLVLVRAETTGDPERRRTWWCPACQPRRG
ncbi:DNA-formamidopyrimidine glycosylase family protein [Microbacterium sp. cf332]|uniref:DNA-formamidopyrimidine glycosylase family protein n=1 Tax=Microbacterium sp. cf332 TaxID=1761804 RepID=UPI000891C819|nr:DNA-formamidopyrimidine glycosylase family protein [Microbacterium sp. cf332]SDQ81802.1 endonuclease-8 [Microbacterium sp. cf332]